MKAPIYKNRFVWALICFIIAIAMNKGEDSSISAVFTLIGFIIIIVTLIGRLLRRIKSKKPKADAAGGSQQNTISTKPLAPTAAASQAEASEYKIETHKVAGVSYRQKEIESIGVYNDDYDLSKKEIEESIGTDTRVWQYEFYPTAKLVPEPDNPHGENAIRVEANGVHIGYIKSGSSAHVKKLIDNDLIHSIDIEIGGGKYKVVVEDEDDDGNIKTRLEKGSTSYGYYAKLTLEVRTGN